MKLLDSRFVGVQVTAQALCKARKKLPFEVLENLCSSTSQAKSTFHGYQVVALDGTGIRVPDTPKLGSHFNKHRAFNESYYPQGTLVAAVEVSSKTIQHAMVDCLHGSEKNLATCLINNFDKKTIFVLDRGLATQNIFEAICGRGQHFVARLRTDKRGLKAFQSFASSNKTQDYLRLSNDVKLRLVKVKSSQSKEPLVIGTTLPEEMASAKEIAELYQSRWEVETIFRYIKSLQNLESFHARDYNGIMQEIFAHFLIHNITALTYAKENDEKGQVNRKSLIQHFGHRLIGVLLLPVTNITEKLEHILGELAKLAELSRRKKRPHRSYPRISKQPRGKWNEGGYRTKELQRFRALS